MKSYGIPVKEFSMQELLDIKEMHENDNKLYKNKEVQLFLDSFVDFVYFRDSELKVGKPLNSLMIWMMMHILSQEMILCSPHWIVIYLLRHLHHRLPNYHGALPQSQLRIVTLCTTGRKSCKERRRKK